MDVSYSHLFDYVRKERSSQELQELPAGFYEQSLEALEKLSARARLDGSEVAILQLSNSRKLLKELYDRREQKILLLAQNRARTGSSMVDSPHLLPTERALFERIVGVLADAREGVTTTTVERTQTRRITVETVEVTEKSIDKRPLNKEKTKDVEVFISEPQTPLTEAEKPETVKTLTSEEVIVEEPVVSLKITRSVPQFYGKNMELFGPYSEDEHLDLPSSVANLLIRKGSAEREDS